MLTQKHKVKKQNDISLKNSIKPTLNHQKNTQFKQFQDKISKLKNILQKDSLKNVVQIQNNKFNPTSKNKLSNGSIISIANRHKLLNKGKNKQKSKQPEYKKLFFDSVQKQQNRFSNQFYKIKGNKEKQLKYKNQRNYFEQKKKRLQKYQLHRTIVSDQLMTNNDVQNQQDNEYNKNRTIQQQKHENSSDLKQSLRYKHHTLNQDLKYQMSKLKSIFKSKQNILNKQNQDKNNIDSSFSIFKQDQILFKNITLTQPYEYSIYKNIINKQEKRNNLSSLSNMSNFQNYYLKSVYEQKVSSVTKNNNKSRNKSQYDYQKNLSSKNKGLSSSLLLSRRRSNNFSSKLIKFNNSPNNQKKSKHYNKESSSKQIINLGTVIKSEGNLKFKSNNKSKNSKKNTRNSIEKYSKINFSNSIQKLQRNSMGSLSFIYENKNPQSQNKQIFTNKDISSIRSNSVDSLYNNNSFKKSKKIFQLQARYSNNNQEQREIQKKNLRRKYQIQQLTLRLKCQLKKINSAISKSAVISKKSSNNSSTKKISNKKKNKKYTENKNYILQNLEQNKSIDGNSIERDCLNSKQQVDSRNITKKQFKNQQVKQKRLFQNDNNLSLQIKEVNQLHKNSQSPQKIEIIFIKQNQFQSPQLIKQQKSEKKVKINQFIESKKQQNEFYQFNKSQEKQQQFNRIKVVQQNDSQNDNQQHFNGVQISYKNKEVYQTFQMCKIPQSNPESNSKNKSITQKFDSKFIQKNTKKLTNQNNLYNSEFQKFILIYAELLILFASRQDLSEKKLNAEQNVNQSSLLKRLKKPLGISSIKLLQMMRKNYNKDDEQHSQGLNNSGSKYDIDHNQSLLISECERSQQCLKQEKQIKEQQTSLQYQERQQDNQQSAQILSSEVYFNLNQFIHTSLDQNIIQNINQSQQMGRLQQKSRILQIVKIINSLYLKYKQKTSILQNKGNSGEQNIIQNVQQYYENYLNQLNIAIFDSVNFILDKLRPFGTRGLPPIHFYNQALQQQLSFNSNHPLHISHHKTLQLPHIIDYTKTTLKQSILQIKLGLLLQQLTLDNSNQIQQIIKKKLQKQSQLISKQLDEEYMYLQDVKFQIFYDIWTVLEQEIILREVKEMEKLVFR